MTSIQIFNVCTHCKDGGPMTVAIPTPAQISTHPKIANRFATAGGDANIFIWQFSDEYESGMYQLAKLTYHTKTVNALAWNSSGEYLASAGDDETLCIWKIDSKYIYDENKTQTNSVFGDNMVFQEKWIPYKKIKGALAEISDICWFNNNEFDNNNDSNRYLLISSVNGSIGLYDIKQEKCISSQSINSQFIQGIAIDVTNNLIATQSTSSTSKIFRISTKKIRIKSKNNDKSSEKEKEKEKKDKFRISYHMVTHLSLTYYPFAKKEINQQKIWDAEYKELLVKYKENENKNKNIKSEENKNENETEKIPNIKPKKQKITKSSLFRSSLITTSKKPCWSPDGLLLCAVGGQSRDKKYEAIHIFHRENLNKKISTIQFPESTHSTCVRFNPFKLKLNENEIEKGSIASKYNMKYKMLYSIICGVEVFLFDTSKVNSIFYWKDEDTQPFFDMDWSSNGKSLLIADTEGFITKISFDPNDFESI